LKPSLHFALTAIPADHQKGPKCSQSGQGRYVFQPTAGTAQALRFSNGVYKNGQAPPQDACLWFVKPEIALIYVIDD